MWKKALTIAVLVVLYPNIECKKNQGDLKKSTDCRRTRNKDAYKYCSKSCLSDRNCNKNHKCLCDGDCGMTCVRNNVKCVDPPKGKLLRIRLSNGRSFGSVVTYSCPPSYTLRGSSKRTCRSKGIWDGKKARCKKFCKDPGEIQHGSRRVDGLQVGRFIYYRCYPHYYKMEGSAKIECQDKEGKNGGNPEWSAPKPVCKVLTCPPPVIPQRATILHGQKRRKKFYAGENVQLMCSSGYSGLGTLMCNGSSWNGEIRCTPKSCGRPREVANGRIVGFLYSFKQKVQYACDEGYQLRGSSYRQCQANQEWGGDEPTCEVVDCGPLEKPDHGNIIEDVGTTYGKRIIFECAEKGYELVGSRERTCQGDGTWSGQPTTCELVKCGDPGLPSNGKRIISKGFVYGGSVRFECNTNYTLMKGMPVAIYCRADKTWSGSFPRCLAPCPDPGVSYQATRIGHDFRHGHTVRFTCPTNYHLDGIDEITCSNGRWSGRAPLCKAPCEELAKPANGWKWGGFRHDSKVTFRCYSGYQKIGTDFTTCNDGTWTNDAPVCKGKCEKPRAPYRVRLRGDSFLDGDEVQFSCIGKRYDLFGNQIMRCVGRKWNSRIPQCKARCIFPGNPDHGFLLRAFRNRGNMIKHGERITYGCLEGYSLIGTATQECNDGRWANRRPVCKASCRPPGDIEHGRKIGDSYKHGERVRYQCDFGYTRDGEQELICLDGAWNFDRPICRAPCSRPKRPINGGTRGDNFSHNEKVVFFCDDVYELEGDSQIICNDGSWSGSSPSCIVTCPSLGEPTHGRRWGDDFKDGKTVTFECNKGYDLFGTEAIQCNNGFWNGSIPECKARCRFPGNPDNGFLLRASRNRGDTIKHGERVTYGCLEGYSLIGTATRECNDRRWTNRRPVCKASCRPPGDIEHGSKIGDSYKHGERVRYQCDLGYTRDGEQELICLDGAWNFNRPICRAPCSRPKRPINGGTRGDNFSHNEKVVFFCDDDYELEGDSQIICKDGSWSGSSPSCIATCPSLDEPTHGRRWGDDFKDGKTVTFGCNKGYDLFGTETIQCNNGFWNGSIPECKGRCVFKGNSLKAFMLDQIIQEGTHLKHGSIVDLACEAPLELIGPAAVYCDDGQWNASLPACKAVCNDPGPITHGKKDGNDFSHGKHVKYKCDGNYSLEGNHQLTCHDGQWNSDPPLCKASCPILQVPSNGKANSTETKHGTLVSFSCDDGFKLQGLTHLTCVDGNWTHTTPICKVCRNPLGMENSLISDSRITSPDSRSSPNHARLNGKFSWCATKQTYLQIDLGKRYKLTAVATQGGQSYNGLISWVQTYKISFFAGPRTEIYYSESETPEAIEGNQDNSTIKTYVLKESFVTKVVRIYPSFDSTPVCLRMELYGCEPKPDCIHVGSVVWGLWERKLALSIINYYLAYITKLNATHVDFVLDYYVDKALTRSYNRTEPVLVIDKIPEMKDISVGSRVIGVHRETHKEWYQTGTVTSIPDSRYVSVRFDRGVIRRRVPLDELRLVRRPRFCTNGA